MRLAAGRLRHRIQIEARSDSRQSNGGIESTWSKIANGDDWAEIKPLSARNLMAAATAQSKVTAEIRIRYRSDVLAGMRIKCGGDIYAIEGQPIRDQDSGIESLTLMVSLGVNRGA